MKTMKSIVLTMLLIAWIGNASAQTYERRGDVQYGHWYRCIDGSCRHVATPYVKDGIVTDEPVYLLEPPDAAQTEEVVPSAVDSTEWKCRRYGSWVCSEDHCSPNFRYPCQGKGQNSRQVECSGDLIPAPSGSCFSK